MKSEGVGRWWMSIWMYFFSGTFVWSFEFLEDELEVISSSGHGIAKLTVGFPFSIITASAPSKTFNFSATLHMGV